MVEASQAMLLRIPFAHLRIQLAGSVVSIMKLILCNTWRLSFTRFLSGTAEQTAETTPRYSVTGFRRDKLERVGATDRCDIRQRLGKCWK